MNTLTASSPVGPHKREILKHMYTYDTQYLSSINTKWHHIHFLHGKEWRWLLLLTVYCFITVWLIRSPFNCFFHHKCCLVLLYRRDQIIPLSSGAGTHRAAWKHVQRESEKGDVQYRQVNFIYTKSWRNDKNWEKRLSNYKSMWTPICHSINLLL